MDEWQLLDTFTSEVEARVVESFLRAQGVSVELLDTHMNAYVPALPSGSRGMRLMVRASEHSHAMELIATNKNGSHLEIVGEHTPINKSPAEKWMLFLVLFAAALTFLLTYFKPM